MTHFWDTFLEPNIKNNTECVPYQNQALTLALAVRVWPGSRPGQVNSGRLRSLNSSKLVVSGVPENLRVQWVLFFLVKLAAAILQYTASFVMPFAEAMRAYLGGDFLPF